MPCPHCLHTCLAAIAVAIGASYREWRGRARRHRRMAPRGPVLCAPAQRLQAEPAGRGRLLSFPRATAHVLPPVRAPSASPRGRQDNATARAAGTAQNEARSAQTGRTGRTAQTARAAQPIAVAARMVCAADWAALPSANRPYGRRQLPEHAMSVPSKRINVFCLFGKIWMKMPPLSSEMVKFLGLGVLYFSLVFQGVPCGTHSAFGGI